MEQGVETDEALVARAGEGDRAAAALLIDRHADKIFAVCMRLMKNKASAEDAAQETYLRLWKNAKNWRPGEAKFSTWLYRVATNVCLDEMRKTKRVAPEETAPEQEDTAPQQDEQLYIDQRRSLIDDAMAALPERQRLALTLCSLQEMSNIEAAKIMEVSVDALESLLSRGRRKLKEALAPHRENLTGGFAHERNANP